MSQIAMTYGRENRAKLAGLTGALTLEAAQSVVSNTIELRQRMSPGVAAIINRIAHSRAMTFVTARQGQSGASSPHACAAALTEGLAKIVANRTAGYKRIHLGGTFHDAFAGDHVCQLDTDGRNAPRFNNYQRAACRYMRNGDPIAKEIYADIATRGKSGGDRMCFEGAEVCSRSAEFIIMNNSHYDLSFQQLCKIMIRHGTRTAYAIGIHPRDMLIPEKLSGSDPDFMIQWEKDSRNFEVAKNAKVRVGFTDGSNAYEHKLDDYLKWIQTTCWSSGAHNLVFEADFWGPYAIIEINYTTRATSITRFITYAEPQVMFPDFKYFLWKTEGSKYVPRTKWHFLDRRIYLSLESYAMSKTDNAWNYPMFAGYCKAQGTVLALTDGEWQHYANQRSGSQLTTDASISAFIWFSAQRTSRSQLVGKAFNMISSAINDAAVGEFLTDKVVRWLKTGFEKVFPPFLENLRSESDLLDPAITFHDGTSVAWNVRAVESKIEFCPMEYTEEVIAESNSEEIDEDLVDKAITDYTRKIAPAEMEAATSFLAINGEDHREAAMYKVIESASRAAIGATSTTYRGTFSVVIGGPGTGKTQYECDNLLGNDLIFVPTRLAKQDLEGRLRMAGKFNAVFTNHAGLKYALNHRDEMHKDMRLWVDEAFLQYPGLPILAAAALEVREIVFVGDPKQIKAKDFNSVGATILAHHFLKMAEVKYLKKNYRSPAKIVQMLNDKFGYDMVAHSPVDGSMETKDFASLDELCGTATTPSYIDKSWRIFTMTQKLKDKFTMMGWNASSVHEFQGSADRRTALIVTADLEEVFLSELGYFIVGFSRCTESLLVCRIQSEDGVPFSDIKIGNVNLEVLTDVLSPVACVNFEEEAKITYVPIAENEVHFNEHTAVEDLTEIFDTYWMAAHPATDVVRGMFKTRLPNTAESVHLRPELINTIERQLEVASFGDYTYLAEQDGSSALAMIETFVSRNANARVMIKRDLAEEIAEIAVKRTRTKLFKCDIKPLTLEELSLGFKRFVEKTIKRGKERMYLEAGVDEFDLNRLQAFMKTQLKSKWEPTQENFASLYNLVQEPVFGAAMEGKAGQGVVGWSKPLCYVFAAWINAIEKRTIDELQPWVIYATGMSESEIVGRVNHCLRTYNKCVKVKGDDTAVIAMKNGVMEALCWDASKFDSSQASAVMCAQAYIMHRYGMPKGLVNYYFNFMSNAYFKSLGNVIEMHMRFGRHSGGYETLWGNTVHSLNMIAMSLDLEDGWRSISVNEAGMRTMKVALGATLKIHRGELADFAGYIIQDFSMFPDVFRLSVKLCNRNFLRSTIISKELVAVYNDRCPSLKNNRQAGMHGLYHSIVEFQLAVRDRLSTIRTEKERQLTVRANAAYYMPNVDPEEARAKVDMMINILATFGDLKHTNKYFEVLRRRMRTMHLLPYTNAVEETDSSHHYMSDDNAKSTIRAMNALDDILPPVEDLEYRVDEGWSFSEYKLVKKLRHKTLPMYSSMKAWVYNRLSGVAFLQRWEFIRRLIEWFRPPARELIAVEEEDGSDTESTSDLGSCSTCWDDRRDEEEEEEPEEVKELYAKLALVDRWDAIDARVNRCIMRDPMCTKTFADFRPKQQYVSNAAYKILDCITEELEERFLEAEEALTVVDIGCAPGGCSDVLCNYPGIARVVGITKPVADGGLEMKFKHDKLDVKYADISTVGELPPCTYVFCDMQNIDNATLTHVVELAEIAGASCAVKLNGLNDDLIRSIRHGVKCLLKPPRSNRFSSEVYLLNYDHPSAVTLEEHVNAWDRAIEDLEQRRIPTPLNNAANALLGANTDALTVAFETITGKVMTIKSDVQLHELLTRAGVRHVIVHNRREIYVNETGSSKRYWVINLDDGTVTDVAEKAEKEKEKENGKSNKEPAAEGEESPAENATAPVPAAAPAPPIPAAAPTATGAKPKKKKKKAKVAAIDPTLANIRSQAVSMAQDWADADPDGEIADAFFLEAARDLEHASAVPHVEPKPQTAAVPTITVTTELKAETDDEPLITFGTVEGPITDYVDWRKMARAREQRVIDVEGITFGSIDPTVGEDYPDGGAIADPKEDAGDKWVTVTRKTRSLHVSLESVSSTKTTRSSKSSKGHPILRAAGKAITKYATGASKTYMSTFDAPFQTFEHMDSDLLILAPVVEESLASMFPRIHPAGILHAFRMPFAAPDFMAAIFQIRTGVALQASFKLKFWRRLAAHVLNNYAVRTGNLLWSKIARVLYHVVRSESWWEGGFYAVLGAGSLRYTNFAAAMEVISTIRDVIIAVKVMRRGNLAPMINSMTIGHATSLLLSWFGQNRPSWMGFNFLSRTMDETVLVEVREGLGRMIEIANQMGMHYEIPAGASLTELNDLVTEMTAAFHSYATTRLAMCCTEVNNKKLIIDRNLVKMNVAAAKATSAFLAVSKDNRLNVDAVFSSPQEVVFPAPQKVIFPSPQEVKFPSAQSVKFDEAQHVIVDENPAQKLLGLFETIISIPLADGRSSGGAGMMIINSTEPFVTSTQISAEGVIDVRVTNESPIAVSGDLALEIPDQVSVIVANTTPIAVTSDVTVEFPDQMEVIVANTAPIPVSTDISIGEVTIASDRDNPVYCLSVAGSEVVTTVGSSVEVNNSTAYPVKVQIGTENVVRIGNDPLNVREVAPIPAGRTYRTARYTKAIYAVAGTNTSIMSYLNQIEADMVGDGFLRVGSIAASRLRMDISGVQLNHKGDQGCGYAARFVSGTAEQPMGSWVVKEGEYWLPSWAASAYLHAMANANYGTYSYQVANIVVTVAEV